MTASEFLKAFPEVKTNYSTGGGCTAWEVALPGDAYVLITDGEDACQPSMKQRRATFGVGFSCCDYDIPCREMSWAEAALWLRGVLDCAAILEVANGPDAFAGFAGTLATENALGFYDAIRSETAEYIARRAAIVRLLERIPTLTITTAEIWMSKALAERAERKSREG
jgi:hypothetical protein